MILNEGNFLLYAMHHYNNPQCVTLEEFETDLKIITYVKKLLSRNTEDASTHRLTLNHIITLFNLFGQGARPMLFLKIDKEHWGRLATYLLYINQMTDKVPELGLSLFDLKLDDTIITELRKI